MNSFYTANQMRSSTICPKSLTFEPFKGKQYQNVLKDATINEEGIVRSNSFYICEPKHRIVILPDGEFCQVQSLYYDHYGRRMFQSVEKEDEDSSLRYAFKPAFYKRVKESIEYYGNTYERFMQLRTEDFIHQPESYITYNYFKTIQRENLFGGLLANRRIPQPDRGIGCFSHDEPLYVGVDQIYNPDEKYPRCHQYQYSGAIASYGNPTFKELKALCREQQIMVDEMHARKKEVERIKEEQQKNSQLEQERLQYLQNKQLKKQRKLQQEKLLEEKITKELLQEEKIRKMREKVKKKLNIGQTEKSHRQPPPPPVKITSDQFEYFTCQIQSKLESIDEKIETQIQLNK